MVSAEELLAGSSLTFDVEIPDEVLHPGNLQSTEWTHHSIRLRPLTVRDLQLISRAAKESDSLIATLMVQRALVDPEMTIPQVTTMHAGLMQFLLKQVNQISGIEASADQLATAMESPLTKAAFLLGKEFGWTPQQVSELTLGQVLLHLQMLRRHADTCETT